MSRPFQFHSMRNALASSSSSRPIAPLGPLRAASSLPSAPVASLNPQATLEHSIVPRSTLHPSSIASHPTHKHINFPHKLFSPPSPDAMPERIGATSVSAEMDVLSGVTGLAADELRALRSKAVVMKRVVKMTKKGKLPSYFCMSVVGSPDRGLVGVGRGRGATNLKAMAASHRQAVLSMDRVTRYEDRTLWGEGKDLTSKWGATTVVLRARPAGFGLMVPPSIHPILTACGIRDASATIEGSRNPTQVMKATMQLLHGGHNPLGLGSGLGSKGRREDKGSGMRSSAEIERERGRYGVDVGRRV